MADPTDIRNAPGAEAAMHGFSTTTKSLQDFASEVQRMSKDSMNSTSEMMEKLRGAKTMEEVVTIQTSYMQQSFSHYADYTRRLSELMMTLPKEFAKQGQAAYKQGTDALNKATATATENAEKIGEQFNQHNG
jgi:phasin family protein